MSIKFFGIAALVLFSATRSLAGETTSEQNRNLKVVGEETAVLTDAPLVPPAITRKNATKVRKCR